MYKWGLTPKTMHNHSMHQEAEQFEDGRRTIRTYDGDERLNCIETYTASGELQAATDYLYDDNGVNVERIVRDRAGIILRRMYFDAEGNELNQAEPATVRWASMDGSEQGVDPKGQEAIHGDDKSDS
jgi:hypothetical protein